MVISYLSYNSDTITVAKDDNSLYVILKEDSKSLDEVVVAARAASTVSSRYTPFQTQTISGEELCKAACCNLSESFETNAPAGVAYGDHATGAAQRDILLISATAVP